MNIVRRYTGEPFRPGCRIAVVANDALGNFVVVTPLLQMLRERCRPSRLDFFGGTRTAELQRANRLIDNSFESHGQEPHIAIGEALDAAPYDLVVNVEDGILSRTLAAVLAGSEGAICGRALDGEGRAEFPLGDDLRSQLWLDSDWTAPDLVARYPILQSGFISEIFCRLAFLEGPIPRYDVPRADPSIKIPDLLVSATASLPEKLWPAEHWASVVRSLKARGMTAGLLGAKPSAQSRYWKGSEAEQMLVDQGLVEDLRGHLTLPQVVGALGACKLVLCLDNGILHLAAATDAPIVGLFRQGIHRLWAPPVDHLAVLTPGLGADVYGIAEGDVLKACAHLLSSKEFAL